MSSPGSDRASPMLIAAGSAGAADETWVFTTLAGVPGGAADGVGTAARFYYPSGAVLDASGNLYVADLGNATIRKITPTGVVSTFAGAAGTPGSADGPRTSARFGEPHDLVIDKAGRNGIRLGSIYNVVCT